MSSPNLGPAPGGSGRSPDLATIVLIPARMASTRLPDKPMADIAGRPMIVHVWERAVAAGLGPVVVAGGEPEIVDAVRSVGGEAVLVADDVPSGTDRIWLALQRYDPDGRYGTVVNVQGDLPLLDPVALQRVVEPLALLGTDLGTLAAATHDEEERCNPAVVKAVVSFTSHDLGLGRALYFTRAPAPSGPGPLHHHIGIYAFRRRSLARFCALPASPLEQREKLEQLRALEAGMTIGVRLVDTVPFGVDTPADLARARAILAGAQP